MGKIFDDPLIWIDTDGGNVIRTMISIKSHLIRVPNFIGKIVLKLKNM